MKSNERGVNLINEVTFIAFEKKYHCLQSTLSEYRYINGKQVSILKQASLSEVFDGHKTSALLLVRDLCPGFNICHLFKHHSSTGIDQQSFNLRLLKTTLPVFIVLRVRCILSSF